MSITAKVILDSTGPAGQRVTSIELRYPRFIHAEMLRHRTFSRSVASSRAIPVKRMLSAILADPAVPVHWGANQAGMQANLHLFGWRLRLAKFAWMLGLHLAVLVTRLMLLAGVHKQIANRICEPWQHTVEVITGTREGYANFFALRLHPDAQPEIQEVAAVMLEAYNKSVPNELSANDWHLPYVEPRDRAAALEYCLPDVSKLTETLIKISAAKCARVSYRTHDGKVATVAENLALYDRLISSKPMHASPVEHQCRPDFRIFGGPWNEPEHHGNFYGWVQYRKTLPGEFTTWM